MVESILPEVRGPARYTGGELGEIKKDHSQVDVLFALAFPDVYEVGMSNLGLKILYHTLNRRNDTAAERVFAPASDLEKALRDAKIPLYALESFVPIKGFDIVGFSLSYELTYTNVINMIDLAGIPIRSSERDETHPLIIAGGHCTVNPEPMHEFIDAFVIGDGEEVVHSIIETYKQHSGNRKELLRELAQVEGVYVPSLYRIEDGRAVPVDDQIPAKVKRTVVLDFENADFPDTLVIPFTETVHDRAALEIMRGCTRTCRFCQAGMITRPVRERSTAKLKEQAAVLLKNTGYDEIGLMSLSSADHTDIQALVHDLIDQYQSERVGLSLPSIRADAECVKFAAEIQKVRKSGLTFAPEAGTQRLRDAINKNITEDDLLGAVDTAIQNGWKRVKLYFMIGLPTETDEDVVAIADLVYKVLSLSKYRKAGLSISVGVSSFVPKPHTPFQWRAQLLIEELERRIKLLRDNLRARAVSISWHDTDMSEMEAIFARGGRELAPAILKAWEFGAKFDGWDDSFNPNQWRNIFAELGIDTERIAHREFDDDEPLPWDHIDIGVTKHWLQVQNRLAEQPKTNIDCRFETCLNCGINEFIADKSTGTCPLPAAKNATDNKIEEQNKNTEQPEKEIEHVWYRLTYSKDRGVRWLSHLDMLRAFERAVRRSRMPVAHSEGFNPRLRLSFYSQLGVGITGEAELMTVQLTERIPAIDLIKALNDSLPKGIVIRSAEEVSSRKAPEIHGSEYLIGVVGANDGVLDNAAKALLDCNSFVMERKKEKESKQIDIRPGIESVEVLTRSNPSDDAGLIRAKLTNVKPGELVAAMKQNAPELKMQFAHRINLY